MAFVVFRFQSLVDSDIDPYHFGKMGKSLADGHGFAGFGTLLTRRVPLYPLVIGAVYCVFGDARPPDLRPPRAVLRRRRARWPSTSGGGSSTSARASIAGLICALHPMLLRYLPSLHLETQLDLPRHAAALADGAASTSGRRWQRGRTHRRRRRPRQPHEGRRPRYPLLFVVGIVLACRSARRRGDVRPDPVEAPPRHPRRPRA